MPTFFDGENDYFVRTYNDYIYHPQIGLYQKFKYCPLFAEGKIELNRLLGCIPSEEKTLHKAYIENKDAFELMCKRYSHLYIAPLSILADHFVRALGWTIWYEGKWEESACNAMLQWYVEKYGIQPSVSYAIFLRECMDYSQAFINAINRVEDIHNSLRKSKNIKKHNEDKERYSDKEKYREAILWPLVDYVYDENISYIESAKYVRKIRNLWVHEQRRFLEQLVSKKDKIETFKDSYHAILFLYEGLFRWYLSKDGFESF